MIRQFLNTLYVQAQGATLGLDHDTVSIFTREDGTKQIPLHHLGGITCFGNVTISAPLIHRCAEDQRSITWFTFNGRFRGDLRHPTSGNVLLRRLQHQTLDDSDTTLELARCFVASKIKNSRSVLHRTHRDRPDERLVDAMDRLDEIMAFVPSATTLDGLRGHEGSASVAYFNAFDHLIPLGDDFFKFEERSRRPPRNAVNAMLSFGYALLGNDCTAALEGVGLDPQVGYLHALRPGRPALALDLMEEFRAPLADRTAITLLNRKQLRKKHFVQRAGGATYLSDEGRRVFLEHWQARKQTEITHPVLKQKIPFGMFPHIQARLLARHLRGDIPHYPPFEVR